MGDNFFARGTFIMSQLNQAQVIESIDSFFSKTTTKPLEGSNVKNIFNDFFTDVGTATKKTMPLLNSGLEESKKCSQ